MSGRGSKAKTRVSSKGQLVLPKEIRDKRGLVPGTVLEVYEIPEGIVLRVAERVQTGSVDELLGCTGYRGPRKTLEDMEAGIRMGAAERAAEIAGGRARR